MTAQAEEIHAAIAEGCEILDLNAPVRVQNKDGKVTGLVVKPQIIGEVIGGRAVNKPASAEEFVIGADIILVAVGQASDTGYFVDAGMPAQRGLLQSDSHTAVAASPGLFVGGECVTGPATVIRAVSAGKAAARAIDSYLGYQREISLKVDIPPATFNGRMYCARSNTTELQLGSLPEPFAQVEAGLLPEEALQEASRCLRCDHFGLGAFREGRQLSW
jgi:NADPH-dependent glutamate synthase beta subunit-like oxidoreductase